MVLARDSNLGWGLSDLAGTLYMALYFGTGGGVGGGQNPEQDDKNIGNHF